MKTKMSFKRAALPVVATLLTAVISLTGVTYAWFTSGTTATVDQIDINVEAAGGLQISGGGESFGWGSNYNPGITNVTLKALSSADGINFYTAHLDDSLNKISSFTKVTDEEGTSGRNVDYIAFDLYFKNPSSEEKNVNIDGTTLDLLLGGNSHYASRIAFLNGGSKSSLITGLKPTDFTDTATLISIYEPNATDHSGYGFDDQKYNVEGSEANGKYTYLAISGDSQSGYYYDRFSGVPYVKETRTTTVPTEGAAEGKYIVVTPATGYGEFMQPWTYDADLVSAGKSDAEVVANPGKLYYRVKGSAANTEVTAVPETGHTINVAANDYFTFKAATTYSMVNTATGYTSPFTSMTGDNATKSTATDTYFTLAAQTVTKVTVVIWLEGQDVDCENGTSGYGFSVNLKFNID